ncbi:hypothetical protein [Clostridium sp. AM58-1XD]|uniref:hypothetical protein n=1 Tax=Clostridium sp. AM58-1XD TaxID=2292307 RepID=UPI000E539046|nr:hypothetical protein [Clostridium sp. AM58-1XD]RGY99300.1 hypothetical protein DXA13_08780 [Clostridium sp. AM58-1XD]
MRKRLLTAGSGIAESSEGIASGHPIISMFFIQILTSLAMLLAVAGTALGVGTIIYMIENVLGIL